MTVLRLAALAADGSLGRTGEGSAVLKSERRRNHGAHWQMIGAIAWLMLGLFAGASVTMAGEAPPPAPQPAPVEESRWEAAQETAVMFGLNNAAGYRTLPQIISLRWQPTHSEQFFHTPFDMKRQFTLSMVAVPFIHGGENYYFGLAVGVRQVWTKPGSRFSFYIDGRFAVGTTDSVGPPYGQGQDMTFSALVSSGLMYQITPRAKLGAGFMYEHFSNGGLSEPEVPNIGLDTIGPNFNLTISF